MENIVELPGIHTVQMGEAYHSPAERDARRKEIPPPPEERAGEDAVMSVA
jgi:hypothetical protein